MGLLSRIKEYFGYTAPKNYLSNRVSPELRARLDSQLEDPRAAYTQGARNVVNRVRELPRAISTAIAQPMISRVQQKIDLQNEQVRQHVLKRARQEANAVKRQKLFDLVKNVQTPNVQLEVNPRVAEPGYAKEVGGTFFDTATIPFVPAVRTTGLLAKLAARGPLAKLAANTALRAGEGATYQAGRDVATGEGFSPERTTKSALLAAVLNSMVSPRLTGRAAQEGAENFARGFRPDPVTGMLPRSPGFARIPGQKLEGIPVKDTMLEPTVPQLDDPVQRVIAALKEAKPIRGRQEELYSKIRSQKLARAIGVGERVSGEKGFHAQLGQLKGEMPKVQYESLREKISQDDIDQIFTKVRSSPLLSPFDQISAQAGLAKVFGQYGGQVPTEGELRLLNKAFGPDFVKALSEKTPFAETLGKAVGQLINVPRSIMSSIDLSAPFRQGLLLGAGNPKQFFKAFPVMFKAAGSEKAYKALQENIVSRPTFELMRQARLAITDLDSVMTSREEAFMSNWAEKIPGAGRLVKASGRAYTAFLNKMRADVFDSLLKNAEELGLDPKRNTALVEDLAKYINTASGRGSLGGLERAAITLNSVFFSPRLMASRLNSLNPAYYVKLDPFVRKQALKSLFSLAAAGTTVLGLGKLGGASVGIDPRSADFGKLKVGDTRYDIFGGFQQYIRLGAQLISGKIISSTTGREFTLGEGYKPITRFDVLLRFLQSKENPVASFVTDWLKGTDFAGEPFDVKTAIARRFIPLVTQDLDELTKEHGIAGLAMGIPAIFGVGTQTYGDERTPEQKAKAARQDLNKEQNRLKEELKREQEGKVKAAEVDKWAQAYGYDKPADNVIGQAMKLAKDKNIPADIKPELFRRIGIDPDKFSERLRLAKELPKINAEFSLKSDQTKRSGDLEGYLVAANTKLDFLRKYLETLDPQLDTTTYPKTQNTIGDLESSIARSQEKGKIVGSSTASSSAKGGKGGTGRKVIIQRNAAATADFALQKDRLKRANDTDGYLKLLDSRYDYFEGLKKSARTDAEYLKYQNSQEDLLYEAQKIVKQGGLTKQKVLKISRGTTELDTPKLATLKVGRFKSPGLKLSRKKTSVSIPKFAAVKVAKKSRLKAVRGRRIKILR